MVFKDLFRPKWKHSILDVRKAAVEKLTKQKALAYVAKNDKDKHIRNIAIKKLTVQKVLAYVVLNDKSKKNRKIAFNKIFKGKNEGDLIFLHKIGFVRAKGAGQSIVKINARIENLIEKELEIIIKPGTYFVSKGDYQNMVTRDEYSFVLDPLGKIFVDIDATCINAGLPIPTENDFFYGVNRVSNDLVRFLEKAKNDNLGSMPTQAGTWAITDSLAKSEIQTRLYNTDRYTGNKIPAISEEDVDKAIIALWDLGIRTQLWEERTSNGDTIKNFIKRKKEIGLQLRKFSEKIDWVSIPAGTFSMGSPENEIDRKIDEKQHEVTLSAFEISKFAITCEQYDLFCGLTGKENPNDKDRERGKHPVVRVSWKDAKKFAEMIDCRLPTEAEWEYACRAGSTTPFNTGNNLTTDQANYNGNYPYDNNEVGNWRNNALSVGSFAPNAWGLHDMHGNIWEWCVDWYDDYSLIDQTNPIGPKSGSERIVRGGYWFSEACECRSAFRFSFDPDAAYDHTGFRLVSNKRKA